MQYSSLVTRCLKSQRCLRDQHVGSLRRSSVRVFKYSLIITLGFLLCAAPQLASSQKGQKGRKAQPIWGSGAAPAPTIVEGAAPEACGFTTLRFTELPFQPVNGLSFRGIQFSFFIDNTPSTDARYNAGGPGIGDFVQDPSLEGSAFGQLALDFAIPTPELSFGLARNSIAPLTPGATVLLFGPGGVIIGSFPVDMATTPPGIFAEAQFSYSGPQAVGRAVITFNSPDSAPRFALDNLQYKAFDISLQDDDSDEVFQFNSVSGDYQFIDCSTGFEAFGRGGAASFGCFLSFGAGGGNKSGGTQVFASINTCTDQGTATIRTSPGGPVFNISDSNTEDNTCCGKGGGDS
jgi:hypothetical protein